MTFFHKPLLATRYFANKATHPEIPASSPPSPQHKLAAIVTTTLFLHACSSLPDNAPDVSEQEVLAGATNTVRAAQVRTATARPARNIATPVWELDNPDQVEVSALEQTVWGRVSQGMEFASQHRNKDIDDQIDWFRDNPNYLLEVTDRSAPFIYEIVKEIERRQLPMELALIPVVESSYNPAARSPSNAAGLWQFMARTASNFGLKRDWWYDGRHDPIASTTAALDYLERLNAMFDGDWLLALAAYNAGEGTVQRAVERNKQRGRPTDFWSLPLPGETQRHVPRLLGLAHVMSDPGSHGVSLSQIPYQPYLTSVDVGSQIDLTLVANLADLEPDTVFRLNPGYLQWATHPDGPHTVWLPADNLEKFESNFASMQSSPITWDRYVIKPGDSLSAIARNHNTRVSVLQEVNNISDSRIVAGQTLLIPRAYREGESLSAPATMLAAANTQPVPTTAYQVRSGDSLWAIANRYKISIDELTAWNNIDRDAVLRTGQSLRLQPQQITLAANDGSSAIVTAAASAAPYQVRRGDTLAKIARQYNVTISNLVEWNRIDANTIIRPGQELIVRPQP